MKSIDVRRELINELNGLKFNGKFPECMGYDLICYTEQSQELADFILSRERTILKKVLDVLDKPRPHYGIGCKSSEDVIDSAIKTIKENLGEV
jgi:hypothetical protein